MSVAAAQPDDAGTADDGAEYVLADAESAHRGVSALVELLSGCAPGQQVTGVFIRSLLMDVQMHLELVVDALQPRGTPAG